MKGLPTKTENNPGTASPAEKSTELSPGTPTGSLAAKVAKGTERLGRILLCLAVVVAVVFCLKAWQDLRSVDGPPRQTAREQDPSTALETMLNGNWQFAGSPWSVRIREMPPEQAKAKLRVAPQLDSLPLDQADNQKHGAQDQALEMIHAVIEMLGATSSESGEHVIYEVVSPALEAVAYAPLEAPKQVRLVRAAQQINHSVWNFIELVRQADSETPQPEVAPLLPAAEQNQRLAVRLDGDGHLCAELISLHVDLDSLQSMWKAAGWDVAQQTADSPAARDALAANQLPLQAAAAAPLLMTKGGESILAIASQTNTIGDSQTLLLIRSP